MRKILPVFLAVLFLLLVLPGSISAAATISISDVISTSQANGSPPGDCVGPDKKHFQTTKEVCDALNKAWGKGSGVFSVGAPTSPVAVNLAIVIAQTGSSPTGDCIGPDKKHFQTTKEVCDALNKAWGKNIPPFTVGIPSPTAPSATLSDAIAMAQVNNSPTGDCIGPDKKHLQAAKEVCATLNKSWGKTTASFNLSVSTPTSDSTTTTTSTGGSSTGTRGSSAGSGSSSSDNSNSSVSSGSNAGNSDSTSSNKSSDKTQYKGNSNDKSKK